VPWCHMTWSVAETSRGADAPGPDGDLVGVNEVARSPSCLRDASRACQFPRLINTAARYMERMTTDRCSAATLEAIIEVMATSWGVRVRRSYQSGFDR